VGNDKASQPWAESGNPVGIGKTSEKTPNVAWHSTENSEEPQNPFGAGGTLMTKISNIFGWI
jgi:hypothetical protein